MHAHLNLAGRQRLQFGEYGNLDLQPGHLFIAYGHEARVL